MKCPNCGETSRIREHDKYCHKCGANLQADTSSADKKGTVVINAVVTLDTEKVMEQSEKLIELLKSANSLANELADTLKNLKLDVKV